MSTLSFTQHDDVPREAGGIVDQGLGDANEAAAPLYQVRPLSCFARGEAGEVVGGAVGRTWGECCELQQLWVDPARRRQGIGAQLVRLFEARAQSRGCRVFYLETFSFQAPRLYESLGYRTQCTIAGFAPGIEKHLMVRETEDKTP